MNNLTTVLPTGLFVFWAVSVSPKRMENVSPSRWVQLRRQTLRLNATRVYFTDVDQVVGQSQEDRCHTVTHSHLGHQYEGVGSTASSLPSLYFTLPLQSLSGDSQVTGH